MGICSTKVAITDYKKGEMMPLMKVLKDESLKETIPVVYMKLGKAYTQDRMVYVITKEFRITLSTGESVVVPKGFVCDGASGLEKIQDVCRKYGVDFDGVPDFGNGWVFHDYLYYTHKFVSGKTCSRKTADAILEAVMEKDSSIWANLFGTVYKEGVTLAHLFGNASFKSSFNIAGRVSLTSDEVDELVKAMDGVSEPVSEPLSES
eukprot:TRINITY_DN1586_c0_g1_i3.p1 TRINITY_DN1586_c0_g1~~TRINITY_DN1586_c0_g1_i3.p1  ORF type:complete len:226 (+),score=44.45 TRINITY_DN1586_c0_g1_i3:61-678(+)